MSEVVKENGTESAAKPKTPNKRKRKKKVTPYDPTAPKKSLNPYVFFVKLVSPIPHLHPSPETYRALVPESTHALDRNNERSRTLMELNERQRESEVRARSC